MPLEDYRDLLDQKRVSVGSSDSRKQDRGEMKTSPQRRFIRLQRDKGRFRKMGR